jgi:hypothetical protein
VLLLIYVIWKTEFAKGGKTGNIKVMGKKISKGVEKLMEVAKLPQWRN